MAMSTSITCVLPEDTFTKAMKSMAKMPANQAKAKVGELEKICVCSTCPTYTATCASKAGESVFCARGTSFKCINANKGCICTTCPVSKSMGLQYQSFCLMDGEKSQRFDAMLR